MLTLVLIFLMTASFSLGNVDDEYIDPIIDLLLNGGNYENQSTEDSKGDDPVLISGIWKCGNCSDVSDSKLLYSEDNDVDVNAEDDDVDIQIGLNVQGMRCVTVAADKPGVVRRLSGACDGDSVTLHVKPVRHFNVKVYN